MAVNLMGDGSKQAPVWIPIVVAIIGAIAAITTGLISAKCSKSDCPECPECPTCKETQECPTPSCPQCEICRPKEITPIKCPEDMVSIKFSSTNFCIDKYESSRIDATPDNTGSINDEKSVSEKNRLPWINVNFFDAASACQAAGKTLCTSYQWMIACSHGKEYKWPWGNTFRSYTDKHNCSWYWFSSPISKPPPTGSKKKCMGGYFGVFDMSGGVKEWTSNKEGNCDGKCIVRGGLATKNGIINKHKVSCYNDTERYWPEAKSTDIGFRCCKSIQ